MNDKNFSLLAILQVLKHKLKTIMGAALAVMILVAVIYLIKPKKYEAKTEFYAVNPLLNDRANIFKENVNLAIERFANENTVDKVLSMCKSDAIIYAVADNLDLYSYYKMDRNDPKEVNKLIERFRDNRDITRTEYYTIEASFKDKDPEMAAKVANEIAIESTKRFASLFTDLSNNTIKALNEKVAEVDVQIATYTDSLAKLRAQYGIYDILSPNRENTVINGRINGQGDVGYGMELIQNVGSIKDQLVQDRAKYMSVRNEYAAFTGGHEISLLHQLYPALPPVEPAGLGFLLTVLAAGIVTAIFMILYSLLQHFLQLEAKSSL